MKKGVLIGLVLLALGLSACGDDGATTETAAHSNGNSGTDAQSIRISKQKVTTRSASDLKPDEGGLVGPAPKPTIPAGPPPGKLAFQEFIEGDGEVAKAGDTVTIQYVGADYKTGKNYDSSWEWGKPYVFTLGKGEVIDGLEQGVEGMAVGDRRELVIPPALADPTGEVGGIPDKETVIYMVDLLAVE
jgi:FKBP-type peptidyl-prolyl cis-trans isomerase